jgi:hypothetical protein
VNWMNLKSTSLTIKASLQTQDTVLSYLCDILEKQKLLRWKKEKHKKHISGFQMFEEGIDLNRWHMCSILSWGNYSL